MPKKLKSLLNEQLGNVPRIFLIKALEEKIEDAGLKNNVSKVAEAFADHILNDIKEPFVWDDDEATGGHINLQFSDEDVRKITRNINRFLENDLSELVQGIVDDSAKSQLQRAKQQWPEYHVWERGQFQIFKDNIELRWGKGLNLLRLLLNESRQIGELKLASLMRSKARKNIRKREVVLMLHLRAMQTTTEILTLIESGFADGAMARWRTLYELRIVANLIDMFGDEIANRYMDHEHVSRKREMDNDLRHSVGSVDSPSDLETQAVINQNFAEVVQDYGESFATPYGWAAAALQKRRPTFRDIEIAVGLPELPANYKMASYRIHAGVTGLIAGLGTLDVGPVQIAGASNAGLQMPSINTAFTLIQFNGLLFGNLTKIEDQIHVNALVKLRDEIEVEFMKAARKLYRDEIRMQRSVK